MATDGVGSFLHYIRPSLPEMSQTERFCTRDIDSMIDTLIVHSKAQSTFLLSPKERRFSRWMEILGGEHPASLLDEDSMVIAGIGELGKCIQAIDQQQRERLQQMCRKHEQ